MRIIALVVALCSIQSAQGFAASFDIDTFAKGLFENTKDGTIIGMRNDGDKVTVYATMRVLTGNGNFSYPYWYVANCDLVNEGKGWVCTTTQLSGGAYIKVK